MRKLLLALLGLTLVCCCSNADSPAFTRTEDVIYGRKSGTALTRDIFQPAKPKALSGSRVRLRDAIGKSLAVVLVEIHLRSKAQLAESARALNPFRRVLTPTQRRQQ